MAFLAYAFIVAHIAATKQRARFTPLPIRPRFPLAASESSPLGEKSLLHICNGPARIATRIVAGRA